MAPPKKVLKVNGWHLSSVTKECSPVEVTATCSRRDTYTSMVEYRAVDPTGRRDLRLGWQETLPSGAKAMMRRQVTSDIECVKGKYVVPPVSHGVARTRNTVEGWVLIESQEERNTFPTPEPGAYVVVERRAPLLFDEPTARQVQDFLNAYNDYFETGQSQRDRREKELKQLGRRELLGEFEVERNVFGQPAGRPRREKVKVYFFPESGTDIIEFEHPTITQSSGVAIFERYMAVGYGSRRPYNDSFFQEGRMWILVALLGQPQQTQATDGLYMPVEGAYDLLSKLHNAQQQGWSQKGFLPSGGPKNFPFEVEVEDKQNRGYQPAAWPSSTSTSFFAPEQRMMAEYDGRTKKGVARVVLTGTTDGMYIRNPGNKVRRPLVVYWFQDKPDLFFDSPKGDSTSPWVKPTTRTRDELLVAIDARYERGLKGIVEHEGRDYFVVLKPEGQESITATRNGVPVEVLALAIERESSPSYGTMAAIVTVRPEYPNGYAEHGYIHTKTLRSVLQTGKLLIDAVRGQRGVPTVFEVTLNQKMLDQLAVEIDRLEEAGKQVKGLTLDEEDYEALGYQMVNPLEFEAAFLAMKKAKQKGAMDRRPKRKYAAWFSRFSHLTEEQLDKVRDYYRAYAQRPEVKARIKAYYDEYRKRPESKEKAAARQRRYMEKKRGPEPRASETWLSYPPGTTEAEKQRLRRLARKNRGLKGVQMGRTVVYGHHNNKFGDEMLRIDSAEVVPFHSKEWERVSDLSVINVGEENNPSYAIEAFLHRDPHGSPYQLLTYLGHTNFIELKKLADTGQLVRNTGYASLVRIDQKSQQELAVVLDQLAEKGFHGVSKTAAATALVASIPMGIPGVPFVGLHGAKTPRAWASPVKRMSQSSFFTTTGFYGEQPAGALTLRLTTRPVGDEYEKVAMVTGVGVKADFRRKGVATKMYEAAARWAAEEGVHLLSDTTRTEMSESFWKKQTEKKRADPVSLFDDNNTYYYRLKKGVTDLSGLDFRPPTKAEIVSVLQAHPLIKLREKVKRAFLAGSFAKGTARPTGSLEGESDVDILLEVQPRRGWTAEQLEEKYRTLLRQYFVTYNIRGKADDVHPQWMGRRVDVYITYDASTETRPLKELA